MRVRASFEASGGAYGAESVTADLRSGEGEPVSWRDLEPGDMSTPVVASEKVVRAIMAEEGLVARKAAQMARRRRWSSYAGELSERPANAPARRGRHPRLPRARARAARRHRRHRVQARRVQGLPLPGDRLLRRVAGVLEGVTCTRTRSSWSACSRPRRRGRAHRGEAAGAPHRRRLGLHDRRLGVGVRGGARRALDVAQGEEPRQRPRRGVLRHAQVRLLRGQGLGGRGLRGVRRRARPLHRVVPQREAQEGARHGRRSGRPERGSRRRRSRNSPEKRPGSPFCTFQARPVLCGRVLHCP